MEKKKKKHNLEWEGRIVLWLAVKRLAQKLNGREALGECCAMVSSSSRH